MNTMNDWPDNWNQMAVACENDDVYDLTLLLEKCDNNGVHVPLSLFDKLFRITVSYDKFLCFEKLLHTAKLAYDTCTDAIEGHELGRLAMKKKRMPYLEYLVAMMSTRFATGRVHV